MPRFENEGFNPDKHKNVDRTVPEDENYYGFSPVDLDFNKKSKNRQQYSNQPGINPCDDFLSPPRRNEHGNQFISEIPEDFNRQSRRTSQNPPKKKKKKSNNKVLLKAIPIILLALVIIGVGAVFSTINKVNYHDKLENEYVSDQSLVSDNGVKNILLLGVDARSGDNGEESRSDTMMLVSLDANHGCIKMVSFLRDTWVYVPTLGYEQRLNAACSSGGYEGVVSAIEYNFGIDIDGYVVADFEMFKTLVDSLGGVEVEVTLEEAEEVTNHPMRYGNVVLTEGKYKLTGEQALAYCRIRKIDTDFNRTQRQRTVMSAILSKAKKSGPIRLFKMASGSAPYIETDLSKGEIMGLVGKAAKCITGDFLQTKVPFDNTWNYATIRGNSVIAIDTEENKEMLIDYIYNKTADEIKAEEADSSNN